MTIKEMEIPLQDVLEETAYGIEQMNRSLEKDDANLSATEASGAMNFMASLSRGHTYTRESHTAGEHSRSGSSAAPARATTPRPSSTPTTSTASASTSR